MKFKPCRLTVDWLRYEVSSDGTVRHVNDFGDYVASSIDGLQTGEPLPEGKAAPIREEAKRRRSNKRARIARRSRDDAMRSIGMVKVRGALGGTYWE